MAGGAFDMSKYLLVDNFYVFWRSRQHKATLLKQPGQYLHFTLWKCHFLPPELQNRFKGSLLKWTLMYKYHLFSEFPWFLWYKEQIKDKKWKFKKIGGIAYMCFKWFQITADAHPGVSWVSNDQKFCEKFKNTHYQVDHPGKIE